MSLCSNTKILTRSTTRLFSTKSRGPKFSASSKVAPQITADPSKPLQTNNLFSVTNYISNIFANKFRKVGRFEDEIQKGHMIVGDSVSGTTTQTATEQPYMNPHLDCYQLLKTPMTDMIQNKLILKNRREFLEELMKREHEGSVEKPSETHPIFKYILSESHQKELEKLNAMEMSQLLDKRTVANRNFLLNTLGFYEKDRSIINAQTERIFDHMLEHVAKFSEHNIYDKANLPNPGDYWVESELNVLNLHLWFVYRRLSFCYDGQDMMSVLNKFYWQFISMTLEQDVGVPGAQVAKSLKKIQDHAYAMWFSLDEILQVDSPVQDVLIAEVVMRYMYPIVEDVRMRDLYFWVRYIRFTLTYLDMVETPLFVRGGWRFEMPDSALVTKVEGLYVPGSSGISTTRGPRPKTVLV